MNNWRHHEKNRGFIKLCFMKIKGSPKYYSSKIDFLLSSNDKWCVFLKVFLIISIETLLRIDSICSVVKLILFKAFNMPDNVSYWRSSSSSTVIANSFLALSSKINSTPIAFSWTLKEICNGGVFYVGYTQRHLPPPF